MKVIFISSIIIAMFALFGFTKFENKYNLDETSKQINEKTFPSLKAVLIVGPQEGGTRSAIASMNKIADFFKSKEVKVEKFYNKQTDWGKIKAASKTANFFVYCGHGSTLGEDGKTGGLILKSMISNKQITEELKFKKNAVIIFKSVCRGAGSSAEDDSDIGIDEALTRVTDYSQPFFEIGAKCYYANNLGGGCIKFLTELFAENNVENSFKKTTETWTKIELSQEFKYDDNKIISIASSDWGGTSTRTTYTNGVKKVEQIPNPKSYDVAYVSNPDFTINDIMK
jgi:hypothetical protein